MRLKAQPPLKSQNVNRNEECFLSKGSIYKETKVQQVWMTCLKPYWNKSGRAGTWLPVIRFPNWETHAGQWGSQNVICKLETTTCLLPKGEAPGRILGTCHLSGHSPCQAHWGDKITFCTSVGWTHDQEKKKQPFISAQSQAGQHILSSPTWFRQLPCQNRLPPTFQTRLQNCGSQGHCRDVQNHCYISTILY